MTEVFRNFVVEAVDIWALEGRDNVKLWKFLFRF